MYGYITDLHVIPFKSKIKQKPLEQPSEEHCLEREKLTPTTKGISHNTHKMKKWGPVYIVGHRGQEN